MGGFSFSSASSAAPAATIFLGGGPVPERLTMLQPFHMASGNATVVDRIFSANFLKDWTIWNPLFYGGSNTPSLTLGSFITAPDGTTNTAQHVAATTINDSHFLSAGIQYGSNPEGFPLRVAFIAQKAELTRCMLMVDSCEGLNVSNQQGANGAKTVFDLSGGQIGVANTTFGSGWVAISSAIYPIGGGFFLCMMDCQVGSNTSATINAVRVSLYLDNGSGTGAQNTSFTGDGTSGIYLWKSSCLPPLAWAMTGTTFFDDFTDPAMGTIDLTNSKAPGFNWYINNTYPAHGFNFLVPSISSQFSQSGSILTVNENPPIVQSGFLMQSTASLGGGSFVGRAFSLPALFEIKCAYDVSLITGSNYTGTPTFWTSALEALLQPDPPANSVPYIELDFFEAASGGASAIVPHTSAFEGSESGDNTFSGSTQNSAVGNYTKWYANNALYNSLTTNIYDAGDGNIYSCNTNTPSLTLAPHSNLSQWTLTGAPVANAVIQDFAAQNLFSTLWLPFNTPTGPLPLLSGGLVIQFFNGICCGFGIMQYGPAKSAVNGVFQVGDKYHYNLQVGTASNAHMYIDFIRVIQ